MPWWKLRIQLGSLIAVLQKPIDMKHLWIVTVIMVAGASIALPLGVIAAVALLRSPTTAATLVPENQKVIETGAMIYKQYCASCHGNDLEGQENWRSPGADMKMPAPPHDASGHTWHHDDRILFKLTKYGLGAVIGDKDYKSNMPAYEDTLSDAEIVAVLSFIKSTWPEAIQRRHDQLNLQTKDN